MANTENPSVEEVMESTELGHAIYQNKNAFLAAGLVLVLGIIGFTVFKKQAEKKNQALLDDIHTYTVSTLKPYVEMKDKTAEHDKIKSSFMTLVTEVDAHPATLPLALELAQQLRDAKKNEDALAVLESVYATAKKNPQLHNLFAFNLSVLYEDAGKVDEAINVLKPLTNTKIKLDEAKVYFELGRLHLANKDMANAKTNLEYVVSNFPNDNYATMAKLYLGEMK